ncbi:hypothetical protein Glove_564g61 [Diversispora epigaea]|uniref:Uncharacterized protein n=1 Tax=Diversispora epigaea TaxID=1348612 RepID=A0A397GAF4_9GLOM|nr:hypothetical protein Glove_564g61 [Diversispora epigaea]
MPLAEECNDAQSSHAGSSNASSQPNRTSTPVKIQTSLLSFLQKGLPTPSSSGDRKVRKNDFRTQEPLRPNLGNRENTLDIRERDFYVICC